MIKTRKKLFSREPHIPTPPPMPKMKVTRDCVVTIEYSITDDEANVLDSTEGRAAFSYVHGSKKLLTGIQNALEGATQGEIVTTRLLPKDAFGMHDPDRVQAIEPPMFEGADEIQEGMQFEFPCSTGMRMVTVKHVDETEITVDLNHPLAGKTILISATVVNVRVASEIEKQNGEVF